MNTREHLLTILAEECAEVAQRVTKALRFGLTEIQPGQDKSNADRINEEMGDLLGVYRMLEDRKELPPVRAHQIEAKVRQVNTFLGYSAQCGTLNDE